MIPNSFGIDKNAPHSYYAESDLNEITPLSFAGARDLLLENGFDGEDSVSPIIGGNAFVVDLQLYGGVASWEALRERGLTNIYAGHQVLPFRGGDYE